MSNRVAELAGDAMLRYVSDKKDGINNNRVYTSYNGDYHYNVYGANNYQNPVEYVNAKKLRKVRKRQY